jgi:hypothetical protein
MRSDSIAELIAVRAVLPHYATQRRDVVLVVASESMPIITVSCLNCIWQIDAPLSYCMLLLLPCLGLQGIPAVQHPRRLLPWQPADQGVSSSNSIYLTQRGRQVPVLLVLMLNEVFSDSALSTAKAAVSGRSTVYLAVRPVLSEGYKVCMCMYLHICTLRRCNISRWLNV